MNRDRINIFTDGASRGNPGLGGWGAVVIIPDGAGHKITELGGFDKNTTNNKMELTAAISSLSYISSLEGLSTQSVDIYTDSQYLINGITKWIKAWQKNGWKTRGGDKVLNLDLWQQLLALTEGFDLQWLHVKGHQGVIGNERSDAIATAWADGLDIEMRRGVPLTEADDNFFDLSSIPDQSGEAKSRGKSSRPYSYVSLVAGQVAVHQTWADCKERVHGVKGARYKKVFSAGEESELIRSWTS